MHDCSGKGACLQEINIVGYPKRKVSFVTKFQLVELEDKDTEICQNIWL